MDTPAEKPKRRRKFRWGRILLGFLGVLLVGLVAFYNWQPWELDWLGRDRPTSNPLQTPDTAKLFAKGTKVLIVTAHPDDSEFFAAGTLQALGESGAVIRLVCTTDGDKAYYWFEDHEENSMVRRAEQDRAASLWGVQDTVYLGFPDGRLSNSKALQRALAREIQLFQPEYIMTFDGEFPPSPSHQDHRRTGEAMTAAMEEATWQGWLIRFQTKEPNWAFDITNRWEFVKRAVLTHESQFAKKQELIFGIIRGNAVEGGKLIGVPLAEAFRVDRITRRTTGKRSY